MKHEEIYGSTPHLIAELFISRTSRKYYDDQSFPREFLSAWAHNQHVRSILE